MMTKIVISVLTGMLLTGIVGGVTVWRDISVIATTLDRIEASVVKQLDDHETRIRGLERTKP